MISSGISNLIDDADFEGMLALALAYMYERSIGPASPWYEYLETIDQTTLAEENPRFWSAEDQELLTGTELYYHTLKVEEDDVAEIYKFDVLPFLERNNLFVDQPEYRTLECYRDSLLAVASRAFDVDVFHGLSLVPGACLFNHAENEDIHFEVQSQVCPICGSPGLCEHSMSKLEGVNSDEEDDSEDDSDDNDEDEEMPDVQNAKVKQPKHSETIEEQEDEELNEDGLSSSFEISEDEYDDGFEDIDENEEEDGDAEFEGDEDDEEQEEAYDDDEDLADTCDMVTIRHIPAGKEVFNTYGELSNHFLSSRYGFALWGNIYETVGLSPEVSEYIASKGSNDLKQRLAWWVRFFYEALYGIKPEEYEGLVEEQEELQSMREELAEAAAEKDEGSDGEMIQEDEDEDEDNLPPSPEDVTWEDEAYITSTGVPSEGLVKMIHVLAMSDDEFSQLCESFDAGDYTTCMGDFSEEPGSSPMSFLNDQGRNIFKTLLTLRSQRYKDGQLTSSQCQQVIDELDKEKVKLTKKSKEKLRKSKISKSEQSSALSNAATDRDELYLSTLQNQRKTLAMVIKGTEKLVLERANAWLTKFDQKKKKKKIGGHGKHKNHRR